MEKIKSKVFVLPTEDVTAPIAKDLQDGELGFCLKSDIPYSINVSFIEGVYHRHIPNAPCVDHKSRVNDILEKKYLMAEPQHLYFISPDSTEEIKTNDWCIVYPFDDPRIKYLVQIIVKEKNQIYCKGDLKFSKDYYVWDKVILSTDPKIGVHSPSRTFVELFVTEHKNNVIEDVILEGMDNDYVTVHEIPKAKQFWDIRSWWGTRTNLEKSKLKEKYFPERGYFSPNDKELFCICYDEKINILYKTGE